MGSVSVVGAIVSVDGKELYVNMRMQFAKVIAVAMVYLMMNHKNAPASLAMMVLTAALVRKIASFYVAMCINI